MDDLKKNVENVIDILEIISKDDVNKISKLLHHKMEQMPALEAILLTAVSTHLYYLAHDDEKKYCEGFRYEHAETEFRRKLIAVSGEITMIRLELLRQ